MSRRPGAPSGWASSLVLVVLLLAPASARGAVVQLRTNGGRSPRSADLVVTALPGESNLVTVELAETGPLRVRDDGARLIAGRGCGGGGGEVVCSALAATTELNLDITLSDGDDRLSIVGARPYASSFINGSDGSDDISSGAGPDNVLGGEGDDRLYTGAGDDQLSGGLGADVLRGGPGADTATYGDHLQPISVTIDDRADDGAAGEGDDVATDVENLTGGQGRNRLVGSDGANTLEGSFDVDELIGGGGDDLLLAPHGSGGLVSGGPGRDSLTVSGASIVDVRDGERDSVTCDNGLARVPLADAADALSGCVPFADYEGTRATVDGAGRLRLRMRCDAVGQRCHVRVTLRRRNRLLARATGALTAGRAHLSLRLNRLGRRMLRQRGSLRVIASVDGFRRAPAPSSRYDDSGPLTLRRS